ncbi:MAG: RNA polymerase sigma-70 factor [Balneolaceae bacterium]
MNTYQHNSSDSELIRRIQSGDKKAFSDLYGDSFSNLCDFVHRYIDTPAICEELVQELFLNIWRRREEWYPKGSVRAYLYKSARNRALDFLKHLEVERRYIEHQKFERETNRTAGSVDKPLRDEMSYMQELSAAVSEAIDQLPDRRKMIFLMSRDDGLTYREIAEILDISVKTVETQMGRSLETLRQLLSNYMPVWALLFSGLV